MARVIRQKKKRNSKSIAAIRASNSHKNYWGKTVSVHVVRWEFILGSVCIAILVILLVAALLLGFRLTGKVSLDIDSYYVPGEVVSGNLKMALRPGELIPAYATVRASLGSAERELSLIEVLPNNTHSGSFFLEDVVVQGEGVGFGVPGYAISYPEISFMLEIFPDESEVTERSDLDNVTDESEPESESESDGSEIDESSEEIVDEQPEANQESDSEDSALEESSEESSESEAPSESESESDESSDESSSEPSITGGVIDETSYIVEGAAVGDRDFSYSLETGYSARLVPGSVTVRGEPIPDESISLDLSSNLVSVSSLYSEEVEGFGFDYLGGEPIVFYLDLADFGIVALNDTNLSVSIEYGGNVLVQTQKTIAIDELPIELNTTLNTTLVTNFSEGIVVETIQHTARLGEPVQWTKTVSLDEPARVSIEVPSIADSVSISDASVSSEESTGEVHIALGEETEPDITISGAVISDFGSSPNELGLLTGRAIDEGTIDTTVTQTDVALEISIDEVVSEVSVTYETPAPYALELERANGKELEIVGPDSVHYQNIVAFTTVSEYAIRNARAITLYRVSEPTSEESSESEAPSESDSDDFLVEDSSFIVETEQIENSGEVLEETMFESYDSDEDGFIDYIEWIVPHLSTQTFIIVISAADHLDENRVFISDIYDSVRELDGNWSEPILSGEYVRVRFAENLTSINDITIYPRIVEGNPRIDVYEYNGTESIASFDPLEENAYSSIYLTNLVSASQDVFDLHVLGGSVEFDHIIDPTQVNLSVAVGTVGNVSIEPGNFSHLSVSDSSIIVYYPFDENLGNSASVYDYTTNNNDGSVVVSSGNPAYTTSGWNGGAYSFNGNTGRISYPNSASLDFHNYSNFSVSLLVRLNGLTGSNAHFVSDVVSNVGWAIRYNAAGTLQFLLRDSGAAVTITGSSINDGAWHHVVVTYNNFNMTLYRNGVAEASSLYTRSDISTVQPIGISASHGGATTLPINATVDEVMIFNSGLSAAQVAAIYQNQSARFYSIGEQVFSNLNLSQTGSENRVNVTINQTLLTSTSNVTVQLGDSSGGTYTYGSTYQFSNGVATNISVTTPNNLSARLIFNSDANRFYTPLLFNISLASYSEISGDTTAPLVTIVLPQNTTYSSLPLSFNVSLNENGSVRYTLNGGVTNSSMTGDQGLFGTSFNATNASSADGSYTFRVYANDTTGNRNETASVVFSVRITQLSSCGTISSPGTYTVTGSLSTSDTCFTITSDNVTLNGAGYTLTGADTEGTYGIVATDLVNITVANISVINFDSGIYFSSISNSSVSNGIFSSSRTDGIYCSSCSQLTFSNLSVSSSGTRGIILAGSSFNRIENATLSNNPSGGIRLELSTDNRISSVNSSGNLYGVIVYQGSHNTSIAYSRFMNDSNGVYMVDVENTSIADTVIIGSRSSALYLANSPSRGTRITNVSVFNTTSSFFDLDIDSAGLNGTVINQSGIELYDLSGNRFRYAQANGDVLFTGNAAGSGNFTRDIQISSNRVFINATSALGVSSNITLYGTPNTNPGALIIRDDSICSDCHNFTSLTASPVIFNASSGGTYRIADIIAPSISFISPTPENASVQGSSSLVINVSSSDASTSHYVLTDIDSSTVLWVRMDDRSGSSIVDRSSYAHTGAFQGNTFINATGRFGNASWYDGADDSIRFADAAQLDNFTNFSISAWVFMESADLVNHDYTIINKWDTSPSGNNAYNFEYDPQSNVLYAQIGSTSSNISAVTTLDNAVWHHVAVTKGGSTASLYVDGTRVTVNTSFSLSPGATTGAVFIGTDRGTGDFLGAIDELIIANREFSQQEILSLYNASTTQYGRSFALASGSHTFVAYGVDSSATINQTDLRTVTIDASAPSVSITYPLNTTYAASVTALNYSVSDSSLQACWYSLNNGQTNVTITCGQNVTSLTSSEGSNSWNVYANDSSGNVNSSNVIFSVDSTSPLISFVSPTETSGSVINRTFIRINVSASDTNLANVSISLSNSSTLFYTNVSSSAPYFINYTLSDGIYFFNATARDTFGNVNTTSTFNVTIDTSIPLVSYGLGSENDGEVVADSVYINVSASDTNLTFNLFNTTSLVNTTTVNEYAVTFAGVADGVYTYQVNVTDLAGNKNGTGVRSIRVISSCLEQCSEGSSCLISSSCMLHSDACTGGICDFASLTISAPVYTLYNNSGSGRSLVINVSGNVSFLSGNALIFSGKNGTTISPGSLGGSAGTLNISASGLFNRTGAQFIGRGGYTTINGSGGNGGLVQYTYHGLIGALSSRTLTLSAGNSTNGTLGTNGPTSEARVKDTNCPLDPDLNLVGSVAVGDGVINSLDEASIRTRYRNITEDSTFNVGLDLNCDGKLNIIDISYIGRTYGRGT